MSSPQTGVRSAAETRARLEAGLDLTRALGEHLNFILHLAREAAEHRKLALEATSIELRDAHLEFATAYQKRIEDMRRAQCWALPEDGPAAAGTTRRAA